MPSQAHKIRTNDGHRYRLDVTSRSLAALVGGYALANLFVVALRRMLPMEPRDAQQLALMLSFIVFATVAVWAFAAKDALRAWAGVILSLLICAALIWQIPEVRT